MTSPDPGGCTQHDTGRAVAARKVLLVDDAEELRELYRVALERSSAYRVVAEAADGVQAVEAARAQQPDVVLLDLAMPRMDGMAALPLIREVAPGSRVVVLTSFAERFKARDAVAAGVARYLVKGGTLRHLVEVLDELTA